MIVRIVTLRIPPDKSDAAMQVCKSEILPSLIAVRGLLSTELLRSPGANGQDEWLIISRWASRDDLDRYNASGKAQQFLTKLKGILSEAPGPAKTYEPIG